MRILREPNKKDHEEHLFARWLTPVLATGKPRVIRQVALLSRPGTCDTTRRQA